MSLNGRIVAFDLGGTRLKSGIVDLKTGNVERLSVQDVGGGFSEAVPLLEEAARSAAAEVQGSGLCVPGLVDEAGKVLSLPGKLEGIEGVDLPGLLEAVIGKPARVVNDAIAYGAGEAAFGAGKGSARTVVVTIGTGVGVTVIEDMRPITAGVFGGGILGGQIPISERTSGPTDSSGMHDTIEALCRAERIVGYANDAGGEFATVPEVFAAYRQGDEAAISGVGAYRTHLGRALVALAHAHAPEVIVLGGGPMTDDNPVLEGLEESVNNRLYGSYRTRVAVAALGDSAALAGLGALFAQAGA